MGVSHSVDAGHARETQQTIYALKAYYPGQLLRKYKQVAILDDTCLVTKDTPDVFELLRPGHVAAAPEAHLRGQKAREHEKRAVLRLLESFTRENGLARMPDRIYDINSGVVIYDGASCEALSIQNIVNARGLLFSIFPHQTLTSYLLDKAQIPIQLISEKFNFINIFEGDRRLADPYKSPLGDAYIYHVTGWWKNRCSMVEILNKRLGLDRRL